MNRNFEIIATKEIYSGKNPGRVSLYNPWVGNHSQSNREQMVSTIATLSYGNEEARNPKMLYEKLRNVKHESVFEFIRNTESYKIEHSLRHRNFKTYEEIGLSLSDILVLDDVFKSNVACFKLKIPIYVMRQLVRHRSFSFLEMSRRYVKDKKKEFEFITDYNEDKKNFNRYCVKEYYRRIEQGEKPETARGCIPVDVYTELFLMGEVEGLKNFFRLRLDNHSQEDIRLLATVMLDLIKENQKDLFKKINN